MDETTLPFSKKVLDRANTIEFSYVDLVPEFDPIDVEAGATNKPVKRIYELSRYACYLIVRMVIHVKK